MRRGPAARRSGGAGAGGARARLLGQPQTLCRPAGPRRGAPAVPETRAGLRGVRAPETQPGGAGRPRPPEAVPGGGGMRRSGPIRPGGGLARPERLGRAGPEVGPHCPAPVASGGSVFIPGPGRGSEGSV